jgi:hypothetical protein
MAYDLAFRRLTPDCYSRGERPACLPPADVGCRGITLLGWQTAALALLVGGIAAYERMSPDRRIRRVARLDDPRVTQEMPVVSMREMVYGRDE